MRLRPGGEIERTRRRRVTGYAREDEAAVVVTTTGVTATAVESKTHCARYAARYSRRSAPARAVARTRTARTHARRTGAGRSLAAMRPTWHSGDPSTVRNRPAATIRRSAGKSRYETAAADAVVAAGCYAANSSSRIHRRPKIHSHPIAHCVLLIRPTA